MTMVVDPSYFDTRVRKDADSGCWLWTGGTTGPGYGRTGRINGRQFYAHRLSYEIHAGPIPAGMYVCHACDNPQCVNPAHLWLGDQTANMADAAAKGRIRNGQAEKTACRRGHPFTAENTIRQLGGRACRECTRIRNRRRWPERYARIKAAKLTAAQKARLGER